MTDPVASASVLIKPDTSKFAGQLRQQIRILIKETGPIAVPVAPVVGKGAQAAASGLQKQKKATDDLVKTQQKQVAQLGIIEKAEIRAALETDKETAAKIRLDAANKELIRSQEAAAVAPPGQRREANRQAAAALAFQKQATKELDTIQKENTVTTNLQTAAFEKSQREHLAGVEAIKLQTIARQELNRVEQVEVLSSDELVIVKAKLAQADRAVAVAEEFEQTAHASNTVALQREATEQLALANAKREALLLQAQGIVSSRKEERELAKGRGQREQFNRAIFANSAGLFGLRGATLAASNAFIIGSIATIGFTKLLQGAEEDEAALQKVSRALGDELGARLAGQAQKLSTEIGITDEAILNFQATLGNLLRNMGLTAQEAANIGTEFTRLAADAAEFERVPVSQAMEALRSGVAGNVRGLRVFGVGLQNAVVQERALRDSGKDTVKELSRRDLALARVALITEELARVTGTVAAREGEFSVESKKLSANIDQAADALGSKLLPFVEDLIFVANKGADALRGLKDKVDDLKGGISDSIPFFDDLLNVSKEYYKITLFAGPTALSALANALGGANNEAKEGFTVFSDLQRIVEQGIQSFIGLQRAAALLDFKQVQGQIRGLEEDFNRLIIAGAGPAAKITNLQQQLSRAKAAERAALRSGNVEQRREAVEQQARITGQIEGLEAEIAANEKQAADAAKRAADEAQRRLDAQDSALQAELQLAQGEVEILQARAQRTPTLRDDIRFALQELALVRRQLRIDVLQIHDAALRVQLMQQLRLQEQQILNEIKQLNDQREQNQKQQRENERERARTRRDRLIESIRLDIDFLHENENVQGEIDRRLDLIKVLRAAQAQTKRGTVEWRRWRNLIQDEQKAIDELREAQKDKSRSGAALAFEFLQTQQGFAATLLSNIVPGLAISGTVGGSGGGVATGGGPITGTGPNFPFGAGPGGVGLVPGVARAAESKATADIGPTRGGQVTQNDLLRRILRELHDIRLGRSHPEASFQRRTASAAADIM